MLSVGVVTVVVVAVVAVDCETVVSGVVDSVVALDIESDVCCDVVAVLSVDTVGVVSVDCDSELRVVGVVVLTVIHTCTKVIRYNCIAPRFVCIYRYCCRGEKCFNV